MSLRTPSLAETVDAGNQAATGRRDIARGPVSSARDELRFQQDRVALFGIAGAALSATGLVLFVAADFLSGVSGRSVTHGFHLLATAVSAGAWLVCRGPARSEWVVKCVDTVTTLTMTVCFAFMTATLPSFTRPDLIAAIVMLLVTITRVILVPSSPRRTLLISAASWLSVFPVAYVAFRAPSQLGGHEAGSFVGQAMIETGVWMVLGVGLATLTSRVVFGLRRDVREAKKLGQYTLMEKLGEGGMGEVFRAQHAMLRRPTAVKLLHHDRTGGVEDLARFEREVQLTAQLSHPNVVTVFDYGQTPDGVFYYAMELLEGRNLEDVIEQSGPMPPARAVHVLTQVASALAEAHSVGLIHRDIKPANIILCARGRACDVAKVVDFGLVKQLGAAASPELVEGVAAVDGDSPDVSRTGTILGTPMYLAPETLGAPSSVDGRADLYALGAVAYFLLTGTVVFGGASVMEACRHHVNSVPESPSARLRDLGDLRTSAAIPADLEAIVLQCLAKSPADRYASAAALVDALMSCSVAGNWTDADARAAWAAGDALPRVSTSAKTETSWTAKTIAVNRAG